MKIAELKASIIGGCPYCAGTGYRIQEACTCLLRFRAAQAMLVGGFSSRFVDYVSGESYTYPEVAYGLEYLDWFIQNLETVDSKGLGLYIHSRERGRGKTTLAHYMIYQSAYYFNRTDKYSSDRKYSFGSVADLLEHKDRPYSKYLVVDDLGNEDKSAIWKRETAQAELQRILQKRRANNQITIITSNYNPEDLCSLYGGYLDSLLEFVPGSRINGELFREVEVGGGEDLRLSNPNSGWGL